ncbi:hypothetical protein BJV77DRAFT_1070851 [Russula vinacea]|nr:hypothetical protein BJV77DRAFT_1070851 [Russula vinacea]
MAAPPNTPIPTWLAARFTAGDRRPQYDIVCTLLLWRFPIERRFMVNPPASIGLYFPMDVDETGPGNRGPVNFPDFIVTKVGGTLNELEDRILLVVEVKPSHAEVPAATTQLGNYLTLIQDKAAVDGRPLSSTLFGMVIVGDQAILARLPTGGKPEDMGIHSITGPTVYRFLSDIAVANW